MRIVKKVVTQQEKRQVKQGLKKRLITADRAVICDIDNTLIGDKDGLRRLLQLIERAGDKLLFAVATGRSIDLTLKVLKEWRIPTPGLLITSVGTEIHYGPRLVEDMGWKNHINYRWRPNRIRKLMNRLPGIKLQPPEGQREYKISYIVDVAKAPNIKTIVQRLRKADLSVNVIFSHQAYLDILPIRASKGTAVRYCAMKWDIPPEHIVVAGDSGNDEEMLTGNTLGVVVGNNDGELEKLRGLPLIYFAEGCYAWGIIEGLDHYSFLGDLKDIEREIPTYEKIAV
jgi:sucrose-phosphate synthase